MKPKKLLLLFLALFLPACIFIFLKLFGRNQFDVPLLHAQKVAAPAGCDFEYATPYRLPDSIAAKFPLTNANVFVVNFSGQPLQDRLYMELTADEVVLVKGAAFAADSLGRAMVKKCIFLMDQRSDIALVDEAKHIRGYYEASDREAVDRMIVEVLILLKKY